MALPAMIQGYAEDQSQRSSALSQSLAQLGQQVGQQLAMREYQRQAQEQLPYMQEAMRNAMAKISNNDVAGGYADAMMNLPLASQNPIVAAAAQNYFNGMQQAAEFQQKSAWQTIQQNMMAQKYGGGGGIPAMTSQEDVLLGAEDGGGYQVPAEAAPISGGAGTEMDAIMVDGEQLPTQQYQATEEEAIGNLTDTLKKNAAAISNPSYRKAIEDSAENPPTATELKDLRKLSEQYFAQSEEQKKNYLQKNTVDIASNKDVKTSSPRLAKFYEFPNAERILGQGIRGMYLKPPVEAESVDKKTGQPIMKAKRDIIENFNKVTGAAINVLNEGKVGDFISNTGGVFNADLTTVDEPVLDEDGEETGEIKSITYIFDKGNPNRRIKIPAGSQGSDIISAFRQVVSAPVAIQDINNRNGIAQLVRVPVKTPEGPTAQRAKGLPAMQPQASSQQFREGMKVKQGGKNYIFTKGQWVGID
jgi:hypothetical protein